jgi:hypothetical protein
MNAARHLAERLPRDAVVRALARAPGRFATSTSTSTDDDLATLRARLAGRFELDLPGLLNGCTRDELAELARRLRVEADGDVVALRTRLWTWAARVEAGGDDHVGSPLQPMPTVLGGKLIVLGPPHGSSPPATVLPRPLPPASPPSPPPEEPDTLEQLLAAADRAIGVRLGERGRDKGAWGLAVSRLLGVVERGAGEPDWRGDVEIKTVPVARDRGGRWRVTEDPAVSMEDAAPLAKLQRVLWVVRAPAPDGAATVLSWYFQEWDGLVARWVGRYLHTRPKGGAGTSNRGWYLHKRFFADSGLLYTLNGPS